MIPVNIPELGKREKELLMECIDTGWISSEGPFVKKFEEMFSSYLDVDHGIAVCNGTAALEVALHSVGVGPGDEVILPSFTIISCALAIVRLGAKPVLVDITPETWAIDISKIEEKITNKTKAIMPVHMYGHPVDMDPILEIAKKHKLKIVEDSAEVHGAEYKGKKCGSIGDASAFSFYPNKIITSGEGGMICTNDPEVAERARSYRNLYFQAKKRFLHEELGYNFRMTNMQAAIGVAQVERIDELVEKKRMLGKYYTNKLKDIPGIRFQKEMEWAKTVYWMYCIELDKTVGMNAEELMKRLKDVGVGTRPFFYGLHKQPAFLKMGFFKGEHYPITDYSAEYGLYLPSGMTLKTDQIDEVCDKLEQALK